MGNNLVTDESQPKGLISAAEEKCPDHYNVDPLLEKKDQYYEHKKLKVTLLNRCISA